MSDQPPAPEDPPPPPLGNVLGAPAVKRQGTLAPPPSAMPQRRVVEKPPTFFFLKAMMSAGTIAVLVLIALVCYLGVDSFYATEGRVELGQLRHYADGPVEVYLVPKVSERLGAKISRQAWAFVHAVKLELPTRTAAADESAAPPAPPAPTFAQLLKLGLPPPAYGVANGDGEFAAYILPVASEFREPQTPFQFSTLPAEFYTPYLKRVSDLTPDNYRDQSAALLKEVSAALADARRELQNPTIGEEALQRKTLEAKWLEALEQYLYVLPATAEGALADATAAANAKTVRRPQNYEATNLDLEVAAAAVGRGTLNSDGSFTAPGGGMIVLRVPLADGSALFLQNPEPLLELKIHPGSARFAPDPAHLLQLMSRGGEALPVPAAATANH